MKKASPQGKFNLKATRIWAKNIDILFQKSRSKKSFDVTLDLMNIDVTLNIIKHTFSLTGRRLQYVVLRATIRQMLRSGRE